ncbi:hypothetical protein MSBRM_2965 [Methanosarcina barkeri MS]|uniref:Uncharacterized protein n=2 Tax=Methanosarcina barkeri TaxID=2208 RepID=A0A0E3QYP1_METBA|nr:hypothetical protein MSBRM_2965 [Methanosarcina barkeri MS]
MAWPITSGDYVVGDPKSPVAVVTLASDYRNLNLKNYAICGTCFTENFGIEKIIRTFRSKISGFYIFESYIYFL